MKNTFSAAKILAAAATLVLLTSGCMQSETGITVNEDGSADIKSRLVVSMDAVAALSSGFQPASNVNDSGMYLRVTVEGSSTGMSYSDTPCDDPSGAPETSSPEAVTTCIAPLGAIPTTVPLSKEDLCAKIREDEADDMAAIQSEGFVVTEVLDDKWCGWEITGTAKNAQELTVDLAGLNDVMDDEEGDAPPPADQSSLTKDAVGGWSLLVKDPLNCASNEENSDTAGMEAMLGPMMSDFKMTYNVKLPGVPGTNNATSVSGNTFTWTYSYAEMTKFCEQPDPDFRALTTPGTVAVPVEGDSKDAALTAAPAGGSSSDGSGSTLKILFGVTALAAAGAGGFVLKRRRDYGYTDSAAQTSVAPVQVAPVWDAAANAWAATGPDGVSYLYDQQTSQWVPRR